MKNYAAMVKWVTEYVESHFVDSHGLVFSQISQDGGRRLEERDFEGSDREELERYWAKGITFSGGHEYENSGMCTGAYMVSQALRYKLTGEAEALSITRRCFGAVRFVLEMGKELEYGFYPKPWCGRFSQRTSTDQVLYAIYGLEAYYPLATPSEKHEIEMAIPAMVEFWRKRNYRYTYLDRKDMQWPPLRFPPLLYVAGHYSGKKDYAEEADAFLEKYHLEMPENSRIKKERPFNPYEIEHKIKIVYAMGDSVSMDVMNSILMLKYGTEKWRPELLEALRTMWWEGKQDIAPDGSCWSTLYLDLETGKLKSAIDPNYSFYFNGARMGWSTMILRGGLQAVEYCPELKDEVLDTADWVLPSFKTPERFTYIEPEDAYLLPPKDRPRAHFISGDSIANWLWSYWLRAQY